MITTERLGNMTISKYIGNNVCRNHQMGTFQHNVYIRCKITFEDSYLKVLDHATFARFRCNTHWCQHYRFRASTHAFLAPSPIPAFHLKRPAFFLRISSLKEWVLCSLLSVMWNSNDSATSVQCSGKLIRSAKSATYRYNQGH